MNDLEELKIPLNGDEFDTDPMKGEGHLLNRFDRIGGLPEYEPYDISTNKYVPLANWGRVDYFGANFTYERQGKSSINST